MTAAILLLTAGGIMVVSSVKGVSVLDMLKGVVGDTINAKGGFTGTTAGDGTPGSATSTGDLPHGGGKLGFKGPHAALLEGLAKVAVSQFHLKITSTFGGVHVTDSYHYAHRAFDASGAAADMAAFWQYVHDTYGATMLELFYDPKGAIKNGKSIPAIGGHTDHVHVAA